MAKNKVSKKDIKIIKKAIEKSLKKVLTDEFVEKTILLAFEEAKRSVSRKKGSGEWRVKETATKRSGMSDFSGKISRQRKAKNGVIVERQKRGREPGPGPGH